jgi:phosphatidylglycerophosphatase A
MTSSLSVHKDSFPASAHHGAAGKTWWAWVLATFFGAGLMRPGPGTWGSLAAGAIWYFGLRAAHLTGGHAMTATALGAAIVTLIGIPAATRVERESGRTDPGFVVIDEVAGQWLALTVAPPDWRHGIAAFVLFRIFDIVKPWPARQLEKLPGGTGIMLDDLAAGAYALGVMLLVQRWG